MFMKRQKLAEKPSIFTVAGYSSQSIVHKKGH